MMNLKKFHAECAKICETVAIIEVRRGWNKDEIAKRIGISYTSLLRRLKKPETFTVGEMVMLNDMKGGD